MHDVSEALRRELRGIPEGRMRSGLEHRASSILFCGATVEGYECEECHEPLEQSGAFYDAEMAYGRRRPRCQSRVCPRCARIRSAEAKAWGRLVQESVGVIPKSWSWKFITLTSRYDPSDESQLTWEALRARWNGYRRAWRAVWAYYKDGCSEDERKVLGAMCAVELAGTGHVHLHCLFLGPFVDRDKVQKVAQAAWSSIGFVDVREADPDSIDEICKYPIDTKGGTAEHWLGGGRARAPEFEWQVQDGEPVKVWTGRLLPALVNPVLAARWEIALYGRRVLDCYGSFRGHKVVKVKENPEPRELPETCSCGARHSWVKVVEPTAKWINRFRGTKKKALYNPRAIVRREDRYAGKGRYGP